MGPLVFHMVPDTYSPLKSSSITFAEVVGGGVVVVPPPLPVEPLPGLPLAISLFIVGRLVKLNSERPKLQDSFSLLVVEVCC